MALAEKFPPPKPMHTLAVVGVNFVQVPFESLAAGSLVPFSGWLCSAPLEQLVLMQALINGRQESVVV